MMLEAKLLFLALDMLKALDGQCTFDMVPRGHFYAVTLTWVDDSECFYCFETVCLYVFQKVAERHNELPYGVAYTLFHVVREMVTDETAQAAKAAIKAEQAGLGRSEAYLEVPGLEELKALRDNLSKRVDSRR